MSSRRLNEHTAFINRNVIFFAQRSYLVGAGSRLDPNGLDAKLGCLLHLDEPIAWVDDQINHIHLVGGMSVAQVLEENSARVRRRRRPWVHAQHCLANGLKPFSDSACWLRGVQNIADHSPRVLFEHLRVGHR
eukprot:scaffold59869_cov26-Tisochrysis_lutea.AAC.2